MDIDYNSMSVSNVCVCNVYLQFLRLLSFSMDEIYGFDRICVAECCSGLNLPYFFSVRNVHFHSELFSLTRSHMKKCFQCWSVIFYFCWRGDKLLKRMLMKSSSVEIVAMANRTATRPTRIQHQPCSDQICHLPFAISVRHLFDGNMSHIETKSKRN